jgi:3'(2'), 5'-bisphosphate nucleotidase
MTEQPLRIRGLAEDGVLKIVGSRSHQTPELLEYVELQKQKFPQVEFVPAGSSLKFCLLAEGKADVYPRLGPTMEWDTAAGQLIATEAGAQVLVWGTDEPLYYNRENLLNPNFIVKHPEL